MVHHRRGCCTTWQARNNSGNVAAVLNPTANVNICYCHKGHVPPKLFSKPKECAASFDNVATTRASEDSSRRKDYDDATKRAFVDYLRRLASEDHDEEAQKGDTTVKELSTIYTNQDYSGGNGFGESSEAAIVTTSGIVDEPEESYKTWEERNYIKSILTPDEEGTKASTTLYTNHKTLSRDLNELTGAQKSTITEDTHYPSSQTTRDPQSKAEDAADPPPAHNESARPRNPNKLKQINDFRTDHYFETHSTEDLIKAVPEHVCVHGFELDDRHLPRPLNGDVYGLSRCIICGKPMENPPVRKTDQRNKKKNFFPKYYMYGLAPKKIYMGSGDNVRMEVKLKCDEVEVKPVKKPNYFDTYALKYQKGVV